MHCPGHQKDNSQITRGNQETDKAAQETPLIGALIPHLNLTEFTPHYTGPDKESAMSRGLLTRTLAVYGEAVPMA